MDLLKPIAPFGQVHIPSLSSNELTASYTSSDWTSLGQSWRITMYCAFPESGLPVEMPSVTRGERDFVLPRTWDDAVERVLRDRAEAWKRLAAL